MNSTSNVITASRSSPTTTRPRRASTMSSSAAANLNMIQSVLDFQPILASQQQARQIPPGRTTRTVSGGTPMSLGGSSFGANNTGIGGTGISVSPTISRSVRGASRSLSMNTTPFEPRVIRADSSTACFPASPTSPATGGHSGASTSPTRLRRLSFQQRQAGIAASAAAIPKTLHHHSGGANAGLGGPVPFARPAYLDQSIMAHLLKTDGMSVPIVTTAPTMTTAPVHAATSTSSSTATRSSTSTHRHRSPSVDSDVESMQSPPPQHEFPPLSTSAVASSSTAAAAAAGNTLVETNTPIMLPTAWNLEMRSKSLHVSLDGRELAYVGPNSMSDREAASARANYPAPPTAGVYYYEVEILSKGAKGHISIGFSGPEMRLNRLPGWEPDSWGYHGDDGMVFSSDRTGIKYGATYGTHDIIGCGIDFTTARMFYTKNGQLISPVFQCVGLRPPPATSSSSSSLEASSSSSSPFTLGLSPSSLASAERMRIALFPAVGMRHQGESVRANFGQEPFKFDIVGYVAQARAMVRVEVLKKVVTPAAASLSSSSSSSSSSSALAPPHQPQIPQVQRAPEIGTTMAGVGVGSGPDGAEEVAVDEEKAQMARLVMDYLTHHGYAKAARAFRAQNGRALVLSGAAGSVPSSTEREEAEEDGEVAQRAEIIRAVSSGDIPRALTLLSEAYPSVLARNGSLVLFKLRCRQFVELLLAAAEMRKRVESQQPQDNNKDKGSAVGVAGAVSAQVGNLGPGTGMMDETEGMDVDDDAPAHAPGGGSGIPPMPPVVSSSSSSSSSDLRQWEAALHAAIAYGQALQADYHRSTSASSSTSPSPSGIGNGGEEATQQQRKAVRALFERTFGLIAYHDPQAEDPTFAGPEARVKLAAEVNEAMLETTGRAGLPALERAVRHTSAVIEQLAVLGHGPAAYADLRQEVLSTA